jgi:hypothetical protein
MTDLISALRETTMLGWLVALLMVSGPVYRIASRHLRPPTQIAASQGRQGESKTDG